MNSEQFAEINFSSVRVQGIRWRIRNPRNPKHMQCQGSTNWKLSQKRTPIKMTLRSLWSSRDAWFSSKVPLPFRVLSKLNSRINPCSCVFKMVYWIIVEMSYIPNILKLEYFSTFNMYMTDRFQNNAPFISISSKQTVRKNFVHGPDQTMNWFRPLLSFSISLVI